MSSGHLMTDENYAYMTTDVTSVKVKNDDLDVND